jgi:hypothetical protein
MAANETRQANTSRICQCCGDQHSIRGLTKYVTTTEVAKETTGMNTPNRREAIVTSIYANDTAK